MTFSPCLIRSSTASGDARFALGDPLVDRYLEFVAGRSRPNTLLAVAFDLKTFFTVVGKDPVDVVAADVFEFLAHQRGDRTVIRLRDGESGLSARTIARRLSSVSGFYAYVVARGDTPMRANPVPRGLLTRRRGGRARSVPLVRVPHTLPKILEPAEVNALLGALRTERDRAMVLAMLLGGLRRCEVLGLRLSDVRVGDRSLFVAEGKGGYQRVVPVANPFFVALGDYLHDERPPGLSTDRVFVVLKGPRRGRPLSAEEVDEIIAGARKRAGLTHGTCHQLRHTCLTRLREAGMALEAVQAPSWAPVDRIDPRLLTPHERLARSGVSTRIGSDRSDARGRAHRDPGTRPMSAVGPWSAKPTSDRDWVGLAARAPQLAVTVRRYLTQCSTFLAPRSVDAAENTLRQFTRWVIDNTDVAVVGEINRTNIEDYKVWLAAQPGTKGSVMAKNTQRQRLRMIRIFFERLIEWDWPDAPTRNPIFHGDIPPRTDPLPKFLNDRDMATLIAAARAHRIPRYRLVIEMLARTGLRATELCELAADAVTLIGNEYWLRVPVGKLRNDRLIPLHPDLVELLAQWTATNVEHIRAQKRLIADHHKPIDRYTVHRIVATTAKRAGIGHVHPHQLRHTLATQAINRGMRLEAIAALLGHRSMEMTLTYARIADRVVADEYEAVTKQIDLLYNTAGIGGALPAEIETAAMTRLRREAHARMLGNGLCTRPVELECRMESACETCAYFQTGPEFVPVILRQRDHARDHHQPDREALFDGLLERIAGNSA